MPKKTIYIRDGDVPLWNRAEALAQDDSVSAILTAALQQYLEGQRTLIATVRLVDGATTFRARVQPVSGGWLLAVPPGSDGDAVVGSLREAQVWPDRFPVPPSASGETLWVWLPASAVAALWLTAPAVTGGVDYTVVARAAWPILRQRARARTTITYAGLGAELGGLHPYHQVPQVLDVIAQWCLAHGEPDLTGVVVSQRSGLPGEDYWRQNHWADLPVADRVDRWRAAQEILAAHDWAAEAPF